MLVASAFLCIIGNTNDMNVPTLGDVGVVQLARQSGANYTRVTMWTQPDGNGIWATDAAAELWAAGLFEDPSAAQLALVAYGDAYVNNSWSCGGGSTWSMAKAGCWLSNCSAPWPMTKEMTNSSCYGYPSTGSSICKGGQRECDLVRWQNFIWIHYLTDPLLATTYFACLQEGAANASAISADAIAEACAAKCHVSQSKFEYLRDGYVHTWRGEEALASAAMIQSWHVRRTDAAHGPTWPFIQIGDADSSPAHPPATYAGPHTSAGLRKAICASIAASAGAAKLPGVCK